MSSRAHYTMACRIISFPLSLYFFSIHREVRVADQPMMKQQQKSERKREHALLKHNQRHRESTHSLHSIHWIRKRARERQGNREREREKIASLLIYFFILLFIQSCLLMTARSNFTTQAKHLLVKW